MKTLQLTFLLEESPLCLLSPVQKMMLVTHILWDVVPTLSMHRHLVFHLVWTVLPAHPCKPLLEVVFARFGSNLIFIVMSCLLKNILNLSLFLSIGGSLGQILSGWILMIVLGVTLREGGTYFGFYKLVPAAMNLQNMLSNVDKKEPICLAVKVGCLGFLM